MKRPRSETTSTAYPLSREAAKRLLPLLMLLAAATVGSSQTISDFTGETAKFLDPAADITNFGPILMEMAADPRFAPRMIIPYLRNLVLQEIYPPSRRDFPDVLAYAAVAQAAPDTINFRCTGERNRTVCSVELRRRDDWSIDGLAAYQLSYTVPGSGRQVLSFVADEAGMLRYEAALQAMEAAFTRAHFPYVRGYVFQSSTGLLADELVTGPAELGGAEEFFSELNQLFDLLDGRQIRRENIRFLEFRRSYLINFPRRGDSSGGTFLSINLPNNGEANYHIPLIPFELQLVDDQVVLTNRLNLMRSASLPAEQLPYLAAILSR